MTLLKDDDDILPFPAMAGKRVAVIGPHYPGAGHLLLEYVYTGQICRNNRFRCVPGILNMISKYVDQKDLSYVEEYDVTFIF